MNRIYSSNFFSIDQSIAFDIYLILTIDIITNYNFWIVPFNWVVHESCCVDVSLLCNQNFHKDTDLLYDMTSEAIGIHIFGSSALHYECMDYARMNLMCDQIVHMEYVVLWYSHIKYSFTMDIFLFECPLWPSSIQNGFALS